MKAALAARVYCTFDPTNKGAITPVDIVREMHPTAHLPSSTSHPHPSTPLHPPSPTSQVRAFAQVTKGDGTPWVPFETAHTIAHMVLDDADTDAGKADGEYGLSYSEFMTCLEGDAINFEAFLSGLKHYPKAPDRDACQAAFDEERNKHPPPNSAAKRRADAATVASAAAAERAAAPPAPLEQSEAEKAARLQAKGALSVHMHCACGLAAADSNGKSDPYVIAAFGKKWRSTAVQPATLDPVWDETLTFSKAPALQTVLTRGLTLTLKDHDALGLDDALGVVKVDLARLADEATLHLHEPVQAGKGTLSFSVTWDSADAGRNDA
jgi:hypothetical protein